MRGHIGFKSARTILPVRVSYVELDLLTRQIDSTAAHVSQVTADLITHEAPSNEQRFSFFMSDVLTHESATPAVHASFVATDLFSHKPSAPRIDGAPQLVSTNNGSVSLSWQAAYASGTTEAPTYAVQYSSDDGQTWTSVTPDSPITVPQYTVTGLSNSVVYLFRVQPTNSFGTGNWSDASPAATPNTAGLLSASKLLLTRLPSLTFTANNADLSDVTISGTGSITTSGQFLFDLTPQDAAMADPDCDSTAESDGSDVAACNFIYTFQRRTVAPTITAWESVQTTSYSATINGQSVQWPQSPATYTYFYGSTPSAPTGNTYEFRCIVTRKSTGAKGVTPTLRITLN